MRESEEKFLALFAQSPLAIVLTNIPEGRVADAQTFAFTFVSPQAERMLGYPLARWTEEPTFLPDHIHPDDRERAVNFCMQNTKALRNHELEYRMIAADGRVVQMQEIATVVVEQNQAVRLRGLILDITKQKMLEEHLRQTQKWKPSASHPVGWPTI